MLPGLEALLAFLCLSSCQIRNSSLGISPCHCDIVTPLKMEPSLEQGACAYGWTLHRFTLDRTNRNTFTAARP